MLMLSVHTMLLGDCTHNTGVLDSFGSQCCQEADALVSV